MSSDRFIALLKEHEEIMARGLVLINRVKELSDQFPKLVDEVVEPIRYAPMAREVLPGIQAIQRILDFMKSFAEAHDALRLENIDAAETLKEMYEEVCAKMKND